MPFSHPERKSPRWQGYDYSQAGMYFVTICTFQRAQHFGTIQAGKMILSALGQRVETELANLPTYWDSVNVDSFVVMPNHLHAIIILGNYTSGIQTDAQKRVPTLGRIIGNFKGGITHLAREQHLLTDVLESDRLWQGRYHDHIIRSEAAFAQIQAYIAENPQRWTQDTFFTQR